MHAALASSFELLSLSFIQTVNLFNYNISLVYQEKKARGQNQGQLNNIISPKELLLKKRPEARVPGPTPAEFIPLLSCSRFSCFWSCSCSRNACVCLRVVLILRARVFAFPLFVLSSHQRSTRGVAAPPGLSGYAVGSIILPSVVIPSNS